MTDARFCYGVVLVVGVGSLHVDASGRFGLGCDPSARLRKDRFGLVVDVEPQLLMCAGHVDLGVDLSDPVDTASLSAIYTF